MGTRLVVLEVSDTRSEDCLRMAVTMWNQANDGRDPIVYRTVYSCPIGEQSQLSDR